MKWFCYDDGEKEDLWRRWYRSVSPAVQARHDVVIRFLEQGHRNKHQIKQLSGKKFSQLTEIIITAGVAHRLVGVLDKDEFTILVPCTHKDQVYQPKNAIKTALRLKGEIETNVRKRRSCVTPERDPESTK